MIDRATLIAITCDIGTHCTGQLAVFVGDTEADAVDHARAAGWRIRLASHVCHDCGEAMDGDAERESA